MAGLVVVCLILLGCAVWNGRRAQKNRGWAVLMGLLLGPVGVWLFPRWGALSWRPVIIVIMGCSALMCLGLILALLAMR